MAPPTRNTVAALALVAAGGAAAYTMASSDGGPAAGARQPSGAPSPVASHTAAGDAGPERVHSGNQDVAAGSSVTLIVDCPAGKVAVSGGTWTNLPDVEVTWAHVADDDTYAAAFLNPTGSTRRVGVHVDCEVR